MIRLTILFLITPFLVFAKQIDVCQSCPTNTIASATAMAVSGDVILVKAGTYNEHDIEINCPLTIKAQGRVIVDGQNNGYILKVKSDHVNLLGLVVKNVGVSYTKDFAAIYLHRVKHFRIENCTLEGVFFRHPS